MSIYVCTYVCILIYICARENFRRYWIDLNPPRWCPPGDSPLSCAVIARIYMYVYSHGDVSEIIINMLFRFCWLNAPYHVCVYRS